MLGRAATDLPIREGYVLSGPDSVAPATASSPLPELTGTVELIALAERATSEMQVVRRAEAIARRGLDGDRYAAKAGTFTPASDSIRGYDLTLIEAEVLDALTLPDGNRIGYAEARRNIVTRGIDLNALVGRRFRIGNVDCLGMSSPAGRSPRAPPSRPWTEPWSTGVSNLHRSTEVTSLPPAGLLSRACHARDPCPHLCVLGPARSVLAGDPHQPIRHQRAQKFRPLVGQRVSGAIDDRQAGARTVVEQVSGGSSAAQSANRVPGATYRSYLSSISDVCTTK